MQRIPRAVFFAAFVFFVLPAVSHAAGQGYFQFTVPVGSKQFVAGLSSDTAIIANMNFGLFFNGAGFVDVRESGMFKSETTYTAGDTFRVSVNNGQVSYSKNGATFYTSLAVATYPLYAKVSLWSADSSVSGSTIQNNDGSSTADVSWTGVVNATVSGSVITKTGGCDGCADAGAVSQQSIANVIASPSPAPSPAPSPVPSPTPPPAASASGAVVTAPAVTTPPPASSTPEVLALGGAALETPTSTPSTTAAQILGIETPAAVAAALPVTGIDARMFAVALALFAPFVLPRRKLEH